MSAEGGTRSRKAARLVWGVVAGALAAALVATVLLSGGSVDEAETDAQARAVDWASTVLSEGTGPAQLAAPIYGTDFGELLASVQTGILADERAVRVRLWSPDGALVFSSDQRDKVGGTQGTDDPEIGRALDGETVSVSTPPLAAPRSGLAGADEELFQTFVPLPVGGDVAAGVAQIDQRHGVIEAQGLDPWRYAQVGLGVVLLGSLVMLVRPQRRVPAEVVASPPADGPPPEEPSTRSRREERAAARAAAKAKEQAEEEVREALGRAERAEAAAEQAEAAVEESTRRLAELEERLAVEQERAVAAASTTGGTLGPIAGPGSRGVPRPGALVAGTAVASAPPEAENRLREAELEHDRLSGEVDRLRAELAERDAELALARERSDAVAEGNANVADRLAEEEARAVAAEQRVVDLDAQLEELRASVALADPTTAPAAPDPAGSEARARLAETEAALEQARTELAAAEEARTKLAETEAALERARTELERTSEATPGSEVERPVPPETSDLKARIEELEGARRADVAELQRAQETLANTQFEARSARARVKELEEQLRGASGVSPADGPVEGPDRDEESASSLVQGSDGWDDTPSVDAEPPGASPSDDEAPLEEPASPAQELPDDALSLRERLVRAAAARHRSPGMASTDES